MADMGQDNTWDVYSHRTLRISKPQSHNYTCTCTESKYLDSSLARVICNNMYTLTNTYNTIADIYVSVL